MKPEYVQTNKWEHSRATKKSSRRKVTSYLSLGVRTFLSKFRFVKNKILEAIIIKHGIAEWEL